jgi:RND family efflux transporter MFP subunit
MNLPSAPPGRPSARRLARTRLLPAALLALAVVGCGRGQKAAVEPKPTDVVVSEPVIQRIADYEEFTGRIDAVDSIDIRARVTGYLEKANFKEGDEVKQGVVLFEIDPRPYKAALDQAEAQITLAEARLKDANADVERNKPLVGSGATSKSDFDKLVADRDVAAAQVEAAKANTETNRLNLNFCRVTAPISGRVSRRYIDPGNLVKADDTVLTRVNSQNPIYAYFDVDERTLLKFRRLIREGKIKSSRESAIRVDLALADERGFEGEHDQPRHQGVFDFADNRVDPTTGTLQVRVRIDNPKLAEGIWLFSPGMFVRVRLPVGVPHDALLIPEKALGTDQGQKFVFVVTEVKDKDTNQAAYRVASRRVKVGSLHGELRVIEDGLKPGEVVVVSGLQRIRDGAKVQPTRKDTPAQTAASPGRKPLVATVDAKVAPASGGR